MALTIERFASLMMNGIEEAISLVMSFIGIALITLAEELKNIILNFF